MTGADKPLAAPALAVAAPRAWIAEFVLLGAIWGASFLFMKTAVVDFGVLPTAAVRVFIAAAFLLPLVRLRGLGPAFRRHWKMACLVNQQPDAKGAKVPRRTRKEIQKIESEFFGALGHAVCVRRQPEGHADGCGRTAFNVFFFNLFFASFA
jgi:hypothetical protein